MLSRERSRASVREVQDTEIEASRQVSQNGTDTDRWTAPRAWSNLATLAGGRISSSALRTGKKVFRQLREQMANHRGKEATSPCASTNYSP
jgi:hypothetical protein